eukprot:8166571-Pyramimonas_sp.AAC.1
MCLDIFTANTLELLFSKCMGISALLKANFEIFLAGNRSEASWADGCCEELSNYSNLELKSAAKNRLVKHHCFCSAYVVDEMLLRMSISSERFVDVVDVCEARNFFLTMPGSAECEAQEEPAQPIDSTCWPCEVGNERNLHANCKVCHPLFEWNSGEICLGGALRDVPEVINDCQACPTCPPQHYAAGCVQGNAICNPCTTCTPAQVRVTPCIASQLYFRLIRLTGLYRAPSAACPGVS